MGFEVIKHCPENRWKDQGRLAFQPQVNQWQSQENCLPQPVHPQLPLGAPMGNLAGPVTAPVSISDPSLLRATERSGEAFRKAKRLPVRSLPSV